jgi:Ras-related protein Rab-7A
MLVFDVTVELSFQKLSFWKEQFLFHANIPEGQKDDFPFLLVANKIDDESNMAVSRKQIEEWCRENDSMPHIETSAKEAINVEEAFDLVCSRVLNRLPHQPWDDVLKEDGVTDLSDSVNLQSSSCCSN